MALTVGEDTFISVADADSYWTKRNNTTWANATVAEKEAALIIATEFLNSRYDWPGVIADETQTLSWPRDNAYDLEGRELTGTPEAVSNATAWLAEYALDNELFSVSGKEDIISRVKAGDVEVEWNAEETLNSGSDTNPNFNYLQSVLSSIVYVGSSQVRLSRV